MADIMQNICQTCLSNDRRLTPLSKVASYFREIGVWEMEHIIGGVCWECRSILKKISTFKAQIHEAQILLTGVLSYEKLNTFSKLAVNYSHTEFSFKEDDLDIKEEFSVDVDTNYDDILDNDKKPVNDIDLNDTVYVAAFDLQNKVDTKVKKEKRGRLKKTRIEKVKEKESEITREEDMASDDKLKEIAKKFTIVEFSEEEMLKNREQKRNRPSYKKLPYKCHWCIVGFMSQEKYNEHVEKKHDEKLGSQACSVCHVRFLYEKQADDHQRRHYVLYRCKLCRMEYVCEWSMVNHCKVKHSDDTCDRIHCAQCEHVVNTPEELDVHMTKEHSLYCEECGERFKNCGTLRSHKRRTHHSKREFSCDLCRKTFMTKSRLESHMVSHNTTLAKKLAYCTVCNVQYKNIYVYRSHLKTSVNHSERVHSCPVCNKKFASKVYYNRHYNFFHLKKSAFKCDICNKLFMSQWRLKRHRQIHHPCNGTTRPRKYGCSVCNKRFYTPGILRSHLLTHSDQRSFMCSLCGDTFKQRPALYTHTRRVHMGLRRRTAARS